MKHYLNFVCNALSGRLAGADTYYLRFKNEINNSLREIWQRYPIDIGPVYRGIILDPNSVIGSKLSPETERQFISFSCNKNIAEVFADPEHEMAFVIRMHYPECQGYMIEYVPSPAEILFHYQWAGPLQLERYLGSEIAIVQKQQEVMLAQHNRTFDIVPVKSGISRKHCYVMDG